jgi:hypothetical protein
MEGMRVRLTAIGALALAATAGAQTLTVTPPNATPIVVNCAPAPGCAIKVEPAIVVAPPPPPPTCLYTVAPTALAFSAAGGTQTVAVMVTPDPARCPAWGTSGSNEWVTLDPIPASQGVGVRVTAAAGVSSVRSATLTIAGQPVMVTQAAVVAPPPPPPATGRTLARLDCGVSFPNCNMGYWGANAHHTFTRAGNGFRLDLVPGSATTTTQFYGGVGGNLASNAADAVYVQMHLTVHGPFNPAGVGDVWTDKGFMLNDQTGDTGERAIGELRPNMADNRMVLRVQKNIFGPGFMSEVELPLDRTVAIQFEVRRGAQGRTAIWLDNPTFATPTSVSPAFAWTVSAWRNVRVGFFHNASLATGGHVAFTVTDFKVTDTFDPAFR